VQYLSLKHLSRDERKDVLRERPSAEFMELINQMHEMVM
jgi:hypothetical protein